MPVTCGKLHTTLMRLSEKGKYLTIMVKITLTSGTLCENVWGTPGFTEHTFENCCSLVWQYLRYCLKHQMHSMRQILNDCIMCLIEDSHVSRTLRKVSVRRKGVRFPDTDHGLGTPGSAHLEPTLPWGWAHGQSAPKQADRIWQ